MMINLIKRQVNSTVDDFINGTLTSDIQTIQNGILFKTIGISLAVSSGIFIGASFVLKKKGHLEANKLVQGKAAGEGHAYLLNRLCAILSSIFLKETLNLQGSIGCTLCIIGATIIVMYAPVQHIASSIEEFRELFFSPVISIAIIWFLGPRYGAKNMVIYIGVCSLIGSLSVVTTQGLGIAILRTVQGENQFTHWFLYFLMAFIAITGLVEINYLNKALNIFNTSMVTPVYYVIFTSLTILSSSILFQGFKAPPEAFVTMILGFLIICTGIILLQTSRKVTNDKGITSSTKSLLDTDDDNQNPGASEIRASFAGLESQTEPSSQSPKRSDSASKFLEDFSFDQNNQNIVVGKDHKSTGNNRKSQDSINTFDQKKLKIKNPDNDDLEG
ncbi:8305_t:CDS:2, partial [Entrophospora sp. SA101]